ncbi:ATP-binding cassette domain-containing protein [Streptomyces gobiensis]|uniref:ATP-binding cassette domain-containing protein n=1 Tax=Streptomyces gobiensis TaxID=2875706 RepID=UPI001E470351|nr:ATP-binding cassette domain-containing protein [Streptomyces gobiensis]UGY90888.1 ATP-binding cassette domain-containing protein [Streptomyces gobiensis]
MSGAGITAEGLGVKGPRGPVFEGIDLDAPPGSLIAIEGPSGSGRTCLLLGLTGRMRITAGHAQVGGHRLPKKMAAVRRIAALGPVPGITDPEPSLTVAEQLRERALLRRYFDGWRRERAEQRRARIETALRTAGLELESLPKGPRTAIRDLERLETLRLGVAMALLDQPRLLAVDDTDLKLSDTERTQAWELLRAIAERGTTVLAVCSQAPEDALTVRTDGTDADADAGAGAGAEAGQKNDDAKGEAEDALAEAGRA